MEQKILKLIGVKGTFKNDVVPMINYSSANITTSGSGYVISLYFTLFLTGVVNLEPEKAAIITFIAGIWDAVIDPFIGIITDRTRSKYGKHRRYIILAMPLYAVSFALLWNSYGLDGGERPTQAIIYFTGIYVLYKTAYSFVDVPHVAMLPELAPDYDLRTQYNSVGYIFNSFGMFPSFFLAAAIFGIFGFSGPQDGAKLPSLLVGIILAVVYALCLTHTFRKTRERPSLDLKLEKFDYKYFLYEYRLVVKNKAFRQYFFMSLVYNTACNFYRSALSLYVTYISRLLSLYTIFTTVEGAFEASAFPFNYALTMKHGKKKCAYIVTPLMLLGFAACFFMNPTDKNSGSFIWIVVLMLSAIFYPFGKSGIGYAATNIFPDLSDVDEAITGRRREGVIGTFNTLIKSCVSTTVQSLVLVLLGVFGLKTGKEVENYEKATGLLFPQSDSALLGVRLCVTVIPIVLTLLSLFLLHRFQMTKSDHRLICAAVATKHRYGNVTLTPEQIAVVEKISGQKYENIWLGQNNNGKPHTIEVNEDGDYDILLEKEAEMAKIRHSKEASASEKTENAPSAVEQRRNVMTKIDINQKEPKAPEKGFMTSLKAFLFYLIQWTWGLTVNLAGGIAFLICTKLKGYRWQRFGYSRIVYVPWKGGGLSLGLFIFMKENHSKKTWTYNTRIHEYGHTWQCLLLGPLYWIVVAIPSFIWCNCFVNYRIKNNVPYSALYCEAWANAWGQKFTNMKQTPDHKAYKQPARKPKEETEE